MESNFANSDALQFSQTSYSVLLYMQILKHMPNLFALEVRTLQNIQTTVLVKSLLTCPMLRSLYFYVQHPRQYAYAEPINFLKYSSPQESNLTSLIVNSENAIDFVEMLRHCPKLEKLKWRGFDMKINVFEKGII